MADWAWDNGVVFEQHYGTEQHYAGLVMPDAGVRYLAPNELACLGDEERRSPEFSIDHWMERIAELRARTDLRHAEEERGGD